jgi:hypothetical protein
MVVDGGGVGVVWRTKDGQIPTKQICVAGREETLGSDSNHLKEQILKAFARSLTLQECKDCTGGGKVIDLSPTHLTFIVPSLSAPCSSSP